MNKSKLYFLELKDYPTLLKYAETNPEHKIKNRSSREKDNSHFSGTSSFKEAMDLAKYGWPEGREKLFKYLGKIKDVTGRYTKVLNTIHDVHGGSIDMGKFCSGEPENMFSFEENYEKTLSGQYYKISFNVSAAWYTSIDTFFRKGAATLALVDLLESYGVVAEIELIQCVSSDSYGWGSSSNGDRHVIRITTKLPGESIDVERLSFAMCHAAMLRRLIFSCQEKELESTRKLFGFFPGGGYGTVSDFKTDCDLYVPGHTEDFESTKDSINWVLKHAKKCGIEIEDFEINE